MVLQMGKAELERRCTIQYLSGHRTFTEILAENGYECGISGKQRMGDSFNPQTGFTFWKTTAIGAENYFYPITLENGRMVIKHNYYVTDLYDLVNGQGQLESHIFVK